jgi:hypothetical protein
MSSPFGSLPSRFEPLGEPRGIGLVLPGVRYSPSAPLLEFARQALLQHGFTVQQVWWDATDCDDDHAFVRGHAETALAAEPAAPSRVVIVAKSLGTLAAPYAAERGFDAIWFTPLLVDVACVAGIRANPGRQLVVGGLRDDLWDTEVAAGLRSERCDVLEVPDADHPLWADGDAVRSAEIQLEVARATEDFLASLGAGPTR